MTLTAIKLPIGNGGALVEYRVSDEDRSAGARICERGRRVVCGFCGRHIERRDLRVYHPGQGSGCLECGVNFGVLVNGGRP